LDAVDGPLGEPHWIAKTNERAAKLWRAADLPTITLDEARHTYASFMIAAGCQRKGASAFMATPTSASRSTDTGTYFLAPRMRLPGCSTPTWRAPV